MTYKEALEYIHSVTWMGSRPGLSRIAELCEKMNNPQNSLRFVHVAGTNGKGSFSCMLSEVLREAGYRVGLFTSPFIKEFNERIRVNGQDIPNEDLADVTEYVRGFADTMEDLPTEFELITAIALEYFRRQNCDIVVLEVGMGGRLDSTTVINTPILSVITEISLDHTGMLGDTVEAIAAEKAGIIKTGVPVMFSGTDTRARAVIANTAQRMGCAITYPVYDTLLVEQSSIEGSTFTYKGKSGYTISLAGLYQPRNAAAVICAVEALRRGGYAISDEALRAGLACARWSARFELLRRDPVIIYDGGHNPGGVSVSFGSVARYFPNTKCTALTGIMADKDYTETVGISAPYIARAFTVTPNVPRALNGEAYADTYRAHGVEATSCESIESGVAAAIEDARREGRPLIIFGSLYMYADIVSAVDKVLPRE
ncbi:MAG: bifunctional folylpolyglutamate synthase/dihydrofolate synthase [Clostridia bacterium]|nr:bifunctional folylpolyglutamate synthase/dihydrofolate synthase [Clostridia bacterium]